MGMALWAGTPMKVREEGREGGNGRRKKGKGNEIRKSEHSSLAF
jgi:hypothetical protein